MYDQLALRVVVQCLESSICPHKRIRSTCKEMADRRYAPYAPHMDTGGCASAMKPSNEAGGRYSKGAKGGREPESKSESADPCSDASSPDNDCHGFDQEGLDRSSSVEGSATTLIAITAIDEIDDMIVELTGCNSEAIN